jgi:hypothetical protein
MYLTRAWKLSYENLFDTYVTNWRNMKMEEERNLRNRRKEHREKEIEQELAFRESQKRKLISKKIPKKKVVDETSLPERESLRISCIKRKLSEKEKERFSKVLSSCIQKMEENSARHSFCLLPEELKRSENRPQFVIAQSCPPSLREGKKVLRKFQKK